MRRGYVWIALTALLLVGCHETRQEFTLNPDGSGKVALEAVFDLENFSLVEDQAPEEKLRDAVRRILEDSKGVETWKDVSFALREDGRGLFRGTAYFEAVSELKFPNLGNAKVNLAQNDGQGLALEVEFGQQKEKAEAREEKTAAELTEEELAREVAKARAEYAQKLRPMLAALLDGMQETLVFHVPGSVGPESRLQADADGTIYFRFEGAKMVAAMDRLFADEEFLRREIRAGADPLQDGPSAAGAFEEEVFGIRPPFSAALTGPIRPLFDYRQEVASAKEHYPVMTRSLGIVASIPTVAAPPAGSGFRSLKVGGVRFVAFSDLQRGIRPFNYDAGYTLSLVGELPGPVIDLEEGRVLQAIADNGADLLPKEERDRRISFPKLSEDRTTAVFDVDLAVPGPEVRGLRELSGTLTCFVATGSREVDLGISEFKVGARGREFGAVIDSLGANQ